MIRPLSLALVLVAAAPAYLLTATFRPTEAAARPALSIPAAPQSLDSKVQEIIAEGKTRSRVMATLKYIALTLGPRATGSPELRRAEDWAVRQFKSYGCQPVVLEQWGVVPGFQRGPRQSGRMVEPIVANFEFTTNVWTQGTRGPVKGHAVKNPKNLDEAKAVAKQLKGAWVLMQYTPTMRGPVNRDEADLKKFVDSCGIAGRVYGSSSELVHTHGSFTWNVEGNTVHKSAEKHPMDVEVTIRKSDMDRVMRWLGQQPVKLEFNLDNRWLKPIPQHNVIADIRGTEKPDEMVIIGGHFDSWNGPGSQGANDNGTGSAVALEAARILNAVHAKPKRTIRFILFGGEEQGLHGSRFYVEQRKGEMDKISAVIVDDGGTGYHAGYSISEEMKPLMQAAVDPVNAAFPDMRSELTITKSFSQEGGSDHAPFIRHNVPAFHTDEGGTASYRFVWHTQNDRIEHSVERYLVQSATEAAAVAYSLANAETLLPRTKS